MISKVPPFSPVVPSDTPDASEAAPQPRRKRRAKSAKAAAPLCDPIRQAEICCEEARAAARLKRFESALGLFATAQSLLLQVVQTRGEARFEARERFAGISCEMAAYRELARSTARPLRKARR